MKNQTEDMDHLELAVEAILESKTRNDHKA